MDFLERTVGEMAHEDADNEVLKMYQEHLDNLRVRRALRYL
jgi:hypothetical protein